MILYHPGVEIETHLDEALLNTVGSPVHLSKTVMNLVSNAAEAMKDKGTLSLASGLNERGDYVEVRISDTGTGIPQENLNKIFDPFFTTKNPQEGTGLGLSVSYGIIQKHHGDIIVESEVGKGTRFIIKLPVEKIGD